MDINNIQLPVHLCRQMFEKSLVAETPAIKKPDNEEKMKISGLGENLKKILFLVNNTRYKYANDDEMKFLSDLLSACKLSMADIKLVNYHEMPQIDYTDLQKSFEPKTIIIFGVSTDELNLPFTIPYFQVQKFEGQQFLFNPAVEGFLSNIENKQQLWKCLKKIFLLQ